MRRSGVFCSAVAAGLAMLVAARADAQSSGASTLAEQLFAQGRELTKANRWAEACPKFEASLKYDPVLGTRLNLASCYEHIGKLASAWSLYKQAVDLASQAGDAKRRDYARRQAAALEPKLPRLVITAPADSPTGLLVMRDGTPIDPAALGVPLYVDPGPHEIAASAPGFVTVTQTVTVAEAEKETVVLPVLQRPKPSAPPPDKPTADAPVATPAPVATAEPASTAPPPRDEGTEPAVAPSSTRRRTGLWVGAGGVAALGAGLVFGVKARSSYNDAKHLCGADLRCDPVNYDQGKRSISDARSSGTISTVLVAAGGVAIAAGAILFLTAPPAREHATARLVPLADPHGAGLALIGGF
jgi:tetratricopeptide (TPR) repeat protein